MNQRMYGLGSKRSVIREIFEFGRQRAQEVGAENVFDFSLGNPSVEPPRRGICPSAARSAITFRRRIPFPVIPIIFI